MDVAVPTPRRVERARAHRRAVIEARSALIVQAIALLCFVMPFDGFREVTRIGGPTGTSVTNLVGYAVFAIAALRLPSIVRSQTGVFWLWVGAYALGTAAGAIAALTGPTPFGGSVITLWQMVGLWALTTYAVASPHGGRLVVKAFLLGMVAALGLYLVMHSFGIRVGETAERTLTVGGYQANQASYDAVFTLILIAGTYKWWSKRLRMLLLLVAGPACLYVAMLANSRGAFVSLGAGLLMFLVPGKRIHRLRAMQNAAVVAGAVVVMVLVIGMHRTEDLVERQIGRWTDPQQQVGKAVRRSTILRIGLELSIDKPLGYGFGNAERIMGRKQRRSGPLGTHNDYLRTLLAAGILGFVLYVAGHALLMRGAIRELRLHGEHWVIALLASFQVFCLSGDNDPKETWILLGLITGALVRRRSEEGKPSTS